MFNLQRTKQEHDQIQDGGHVGLLKPDLCLSFWCRFSISMMQKFDWRPNHG